MMAPRHALLLSIFGLAQLCWAQSDDGGAFQVVQPKSSTSTAPVWEPPNGVGGQLEQEPSMAWMLVRTLVVLALVVGLAYLSLNWGLRKLLVGGSMNGGSSSMLTVVERLIIEPKRSLFIIEAAGEYWLLASSEQGFSPVSKLSTADVERLKREKDMKNQQLSPFLAKLLKGRGENPPKAS